MVILLEVSWFWVLFLIAIATDNHKHSTLKQHRFITFSSEDEKSKMGLPGLKSRGQQDWFPLEALVKSCVLCQLLEAAYISWPVDPSSIFKSSHRTSTSVVASFSCCFLLTEILIKPSLGPP